MCIHDTTSCDCDVCLLPTDYILPIFFMVLRTVERELIITTLLVIPILLLQTPHSIRCLHNSQSAQHQTVKIGTGIGTIPALVFNRQYHYRALASPGVCMGGQEGLGHTVKKGGTEVS